MGYLVTIEAPDASGKATQTKMLCEHLERDGYKTAKFSFPNYESRACEPVKMYLEGALGDKPSDTSAYAASVFFAVDRYFSYVQNFKKLLEEDYVVVLDRYTTSNAVHQISKLPENEWDEFLSWLYDFEYKKLSLPVPDITVSLDVPVSTSYKLLEKRAVEDDRKKDIHENDREYLEKCYKASLYTREKWGWAKIECCDENGDMKSREDIHKIIYEKVINSMPEGMKK